MWKGSNQLRQISNTYFTQIKKAKKYCLVAKKYRLVTIVTHPDKKYYIWNPNKKQRQSAQSFKEKVYKITKKLSEKQL